MIKYLLNHIGGGEAPDSPPLRYVVIPALHFCAYSKACSAAWMLGYHDTRKSAMLYENTIDNESGYRIRKLNTLSKTPGILTRSTGPWRWSSVSINQVSDLDMLRISDSDGIVDSGNVAIRDSCRFKHKTEVRSSPAMPSWATPIYVCNLINTLHWYCFI